MCKQQEIAFSQLNYDSKDYPLADPSETGVMVYTCKQCDRDQAYRIAKACEKKLNKEKNFELTADTINEEFNGIETNMLTNLTNVEADILQKEMAANNIYSAKLYNAETKTYAVEISAQDMEERTFKDEMTPLERSMAASVLKLSNPALMEYLNRKDAAREAVSGVIEQASHNPEIAQVIADPEHPKNRFIVKDSKVMFTIDNTVMNTYDLANKKKRKHVLAALQNTTPLLLQLNRNIMRNERIISTTSNSLQRKIPKRVFSMSILTMRQKNWNRKTLLTLLFTRATSL